MPYDKNETKGSPASPSGRTERSRGPLRPAGQTFGALDGSQRQIEMNGAKARE